MKKLLLLMSAIALLAGCACKNCNIVNPGETSKPAPQEKTK
ncbi:MAG: hypothetical protein WCI43_08515 [Candidatus Firestonebacteria bacterium]